MLTEEKLKELEEIASDNYPRWTGPGRLIQKETLRSLIAAARELEVVKRNLAEAIRRGCSCDLMNGYACDIHALGQAGDPQ